MRLCHVGVVCALIAALARVSYAKRAEPVAVLRVHSVGAAVDHLSGALAADGRQRVSFGVVFDATGSMYDDLRQLLRGVEDVLKVVVQSEVHTIQNFIFVPYHDPVIGPAVVTDDYHQFYDSLKMLDVRGGGDCPEMALTGLKLALEEALPNSHIYVFTDASAKDHHLLEEVMSLISDKTPQIVFVLTGDCDDRDGPGQAVFRRIAAVTSGHMFHLKKDSVQQVLQFVRESLRPQKVSLASVDHDPRHKSVPDKGASSPSPVSPDGTSAAASEAAPHTSVGAADTSTGGGVEAVQIHVDRSLQEFTVSVSGNQPDFTIRESLGPDNVTGNVILDLPKVKVVNVKNPKPGRYHVTVHDEDSAFTLRATAISGVAFEFGFSKDPRGKLDDSLDRPIQGEQNYLLVRPVNSSHKMQPTHAQLTSLGDQLLQNITLTQAEAPANVYRGGPFFPPTDLFRIKIHGQDEDDSAVQRQTPAISAVLIGKPTVEAESTVTGHLGQNVTIPCRVRSYLPMKAGWYFDTLPFSAFQNYSQSSRSRLLNLNLFNLTEEDEGVYICTGRNSRGKAFQMVELRVTEPLPAVKAAHNITVLEGMPVYLPCDVSSDTPYNVTWKRAEWFHGGSPLPRPAHTDYLHLPAVNIHSTGRYECTATNRGGSTSSETLLVVHSAPKVGISTPGAVFLPRQQVVIICQAYGVPRPNVSWTRGDGAPVTSTPDKRIEVERSLLRMSNASEADEGVYSCTGTNQYGSATQSLFIRYAEPPRVTIANTSVVGAIASPVMLRCSATGTPPPELSWLRGATPIQSAGPIKVTSSGELHILSLQSSQTGSYTCMAKNEYGKDSGTVTVNIGAVPKILVQNYDVEIPYAGSSSLPCPAVGRPSPSIRWTRAAEHLANVDESGTLLIEGAGEEDAGIYTCTAANSYGLDSLQVHLSILKPEAPVLATLPPFTMGTRGYPLWLACEVLRAEPAARFSWSHDGRPVALGAERRVLSNGTLLLSAARPRDAGDYVCTASNAAGAASVSTRVHILYAPRISGADNQLLEASENETVFLPCETASSPPPRVIWTRDQPLEIPFNGRLHVHGNNTLQISHVLEEDGGVYTCHVNNTRGVAVARRVLVVHAPPRIVRIRADVGHPDEGEVPAGDAGDYTVLTAPEPRLERRALARNIGTDGDHSRPTVTVQEGEEVTILCDLQPDDVAHVTWNTPGSRSPAGATQLDNGALRFQASRAAGGAYECRASNEYGSVAAPLQLRVKPEPRESGPVHISTAVQGRDLTLRCKVRGRPKPVITWYRHEQLLVADAIKYSRHNGHSLVVHNVQTSDAGRYACVATNAKGSMKKYTDVHVHVPPSIEMAVGAALAVRRGSRLLLEATVAGTPPPQVRWLHDGLQLFTNTETAGGASRLEVASASSEDAGRYVLLASNAAGDAERAVQVTVVSSVLCNRAVQQGCRGAETSAASADMVTAYSANANSASASTTNSAIAPAAAAGAGLNRFRRRALVVNDEGWRDSIDVIDGESYQMDCPASGDVINIKWLRNGESLAESFTRTRADQTHVVIGEGGQFLRIPETTAEDSGEYTCVAETLVGSERFTQRLSVLVPPRFSVPFHQSTERVLAEQDTVTLDCGVRGVPPPEVIWKKDGALLSESDVRNHIISADGHSLTVRGRLETAGNYLCEAVNSAGSTVRTFPVRVRVAPRLSGPDPTVVVIMREDTVTLNCSIVGSPPPAVVWNKDGRNVVGVPWIEPDSGFVYYPHQGEHSQRLVVSAARLADAGWFQCIGNNRLGQASARIQLIVDGAPLIDDGAEVVRVTAVPGSSHTLQCPVQSHPLATVSWTKDGKVIKVIPPPSDGTNLSDTEQTPFFLPENNRKRRRRDIDASDLSHLSATFGDELSRGAAESPAADEEFDEQFSPGDTSLTLTNIVAEDDGLYTCTASNEHGVASKQISVQVLEAPVILELPLERRLILHDQTEAKCMTTGIPDPDVYWMKDGVAVSEANIPHLYEADGDPSTLLLHLITPRMAGLYTCVAKNPAGEATRDMKVVVVEPPIIAAPTTVDISAVEDSGQLLTCDVISSAPAHISWLFNGQLVEHSAESADWNIHDNHTLALRSVSDEQAGDWTCLAANEAGSDELTYSLRVLVAPYFEEDSEEYRGKLHRPLVLRCPAAGVPKPTISWYKDEQQLVNTTELTLQGNMLRISGLNAEHTGSYRCTATNIVSSVNMEMPLQVLEPPRISAGPAPLLVVAEGEPLHLRCQAGGRPTPRISWYRDGAPLPEDSPLLRGQRGTLSAEAASTRHSGLYSCLAWNELGTDRTETVVSVIAPPELEDADRELVARLDEVVVIRCPLSEYYPETEISWDKDGSAVTTNTSSLFVSEDQLSVLLPRVQTTDAGLFTCHVHNDAGRDSHQRRLTVHVPPVLKDYPAQLHVRKDSELTLECELFNEPQPVVERIWRRNGHQVIPDQRVQLLASGALQLQQVEPGDGGSYTCRVHSEAGDDVRRTKLTVLQSPSVLVDDKEVVVVTGDPLRLVCHAAGTPDPDVAWSRWKGGMVVPLTGSLAFGPFMASDHHIYKESADLTDTGEFRCTATNSVGEASSNVTVRVISPPLLEDPAAGTPVQQAVRAGEEALFSCRIRGGEPTPQVVWLRDGMELPDQTEQSLHLASVAPSDTGNYTCLVANEAGSIKRDFFLHVLSVPSIMRAESPAIDVAEGSEFSLPCFVESYEAFNVTWLKDGSAFSPTLSEMYHTTEGGQLLRVLRADPDHAANYTCRTFSSSGQDSQTFSVNVLTPARVSTSLDDLTENPDGTLAMDVPVGTETQLSCHVTGNPAPQVVWTKDGQVVSAAVERHDGVARLPVAAEGASASGEYRCSADNGVGNDSISYRLRVVSLPALRSEVDHLVTVQLRDSASMICDVAGVPEPKVLWSKDGQMIKHQPGKYEMEGHSLHVKYVQLEDGGNFSCFAVNDVGMLTVPFELSVIERPKITLPALVSALEGGDLDLTCTAEGVPLPTVSWQRGQREVRDGSRVRSLGSTLTIEDMKPTNAGEYECLAKNSAGVQRATVFVEVLEKPRLTTRGDERVGAPLGVPLSLSCPVDTEFIGDYRVDWMRGSPPLDSPVADVISGPGYATDDLDLELTFPLERDAGEVTCRVTAPAGSVQYLFQLDVLWPPQLKLTPEELADPIEQLEGQPLVLECQISANPPPTVVWYNRSQPIVAETDRLQFPSSSELLVRELAASDADAFSCFAINELGNLTQPFSVDVLSAPSVKTSEEVEVHAGLPARLPCAVGGNPPPSRVWYTSSSSSVASLPPGGTSENYRHVAASGELVVTASSLDDAGVFTCVATSVVGTARAQTLLSVVVPPSVEGDENEAVETQLGGSVTLRCTMHGHPSPSVTWYKADEEIRPRSSVDDGGQTLTLTDLDASSAGLFSCKASNKAGTATKQFSLRVSESAQQVQTATREVEAQLSKPLSLSCPLVGPTAASTVWLRRGRILHRGPKLVVPNVKKMDGGKYQCISSSLARSRITKYIVKVKEPPRVQEDAPKGAVHQPQLGYPLRLSCPIESSAPLRWRRNGRPLSQRDSVHMSGSLLFIPSVSEADAGRFTCEASNSAGSATYEFDVRVVEPPFFSGPAAERVVTTAGGDITLRCDAGGLPTPTVTWYQNGEERGRQSSLRLSPVDGSDDGVFTCVAENEVGREDREVVVDVIEAPVIAGDEAETVRVALGETTLLPCSTKTQNPAVSWFRAAAPVSLRSGRLSLTADGLQVARARTQDRGKYRCVVSNAAGTADKFIRLIVSAPAEVEERHLHLVVGERMVLSCPQLPPTEDRSQASWAWSSDAEATKDSLTESAVAPRPLVVAHVEGRHARRYRCQATTPSGDVKALVWDVHIRNSIDLHVEPAGPVTSQRGDQLTLTCQTSAGPGVQLTWYRNDSRLDLSSQRYASSTSRTKSPVVVSSLTIDELESGDAGVYMCRAEAGSVTETRPVQLAVESAPEIVSSSPEALETSAGDRLHVHCDVTGSPAPLLHWFRGQHLLQERDGLRMIDGKLIIDRFQIADEGEYMCVAVNKLGKAAKAFKISVKMAPTFTETPRDLVVPKMENFTLRCAAEGAPPAVLTWLRDGRPLAAPAPTKAVSTLTVHLAGVEDAGVYTCQAENSAGVRRAAANVTVFQRLGPPALEPLPQRYVLREGEAGGLLCRATAAAAAIHWEKVGGDPSSTLSTAQLDGASRLEFRAARASDAGLYRCVAKNAAGASRVQVKVVVNRPPTIMQQPHAKISRPMGTPLSLPCVASGWPRPIISWHHNDAPISELPGARQLADGSLLLASLEQRYDGTYTCRATNELGVHQTSVDVSITESAPASPGATFLPGPAVIRAEAGRPVTLCRLTDYPSENYLLRVTHDRQSVPMDALAVGPPPPSEGDEATSRVVHIGLAGVAEADAGSYTCQLIDHTNGNMMKHRVELEVDSGWEPWTSCSVTCGTGVRIRDRDCSRFLPCQESSPCVLPECVPRLLGAVGSIHGEVNSVPISGGEVVARVVGDPDRGQLYSTVGGLHQKALPVVTALLPLLSPAPWLAAQQVDGAQNGLQLTGGLFRKQTDLVFPTGEKLSITHTGLGVEPNGTLLYNTEVKGRLPQLPDDVAAIVPARFKGGLVQTGSGDLYSHSTQYYQAGGILVPFAVNESITYDGSRGQMPDLVQSLNVDSDNVHYDVTTNHLLARITAQVHRQNDSCPSGYSKRMEAGAMFCADEDECLDSPCSHICTNIVSSYRCECPVGFTVSRDRHTCQDIDECAWGVSSCPTGHLCENTPGSYRCIHSCGAGTRQAADGTCYDVNECEQSPPPCEQLCHNTGGNYSCDCYQGYQLVAGGRCVDIDECNQMLGACSHTCINIPGSYRCSCPAGMRLLPNGKCTDIDECATKTHNCYYDEQCVNTAGSFHCVRPCDRGYKLDADGVCQDIDECAKMMDRCHYSQQCRNLPGSYRCVCPPGFSSDGPGFPCTDIDECSIPGTCQHNCTNLDGGYRCSCPSGYRLNHNKRNCDDIDECSENAVQCARDQTCFNQRGGYSCTDVRCPQHHVRDPATSVCLRFCRHRELCAPEARYAEALSYKLLALRAGVRPGQRVDELMIRGTGRGRLRRPARFRLAPTSASAPFAVRTRNGSGVVLTRRALPPGSNYRVHVDAYTYNEATRRWRRSMQFVIVIAVSEYPY